jgi:DNA adenine methylase
MWSRRWRRRKGDEKFQFERHGYFVAGKFNVPFAASKTGALPSWDEITEAVKQLRRASTSSEDFESLVKSKIEANDFVYLDPPYAVENERVFKQYNATTFGLSDLERLKNALSIIDKRGAKFVLSYAHCPEALDAFSEWHHEEVSCQRNVAGFAHHRRRATELMFSNITRVKNG